MKNSMIIYESAYLAIKYLPDDATKWEAMEGLLRYGFYGETPTSDNPLINMIYVQATPSMQNAKKRYEKSVSDGALGGRPSRAPIEEILAMKNGGMTNKQIAEKIGCSPKTIENRITYYRKKLHPQNPQNLSVSVSVSESVSSSLSEIGDKKEEVANAKKEKTIEDLTEKEGAEIIEKIQNRIKYVKIQQEYHLKEPVTKEFPKQWRDELIRRNDAEEQKEIESNKPSYEFLKEFWDLDSLEETKQRTQVFLDKYPTWTLDGLVKVLKQNNKLDLKTYNATTKKTRTYDWAMQGYKSKPSVLYIDWLNSKMCELNNN